MPGRLLEGIGQLDQLGLAPGPPHERHAHGKPEHVACRQLVLRLHQPDMKARELHGEIIRALRSEYEHNLSQQMYLSIGSWQMIRTAKEETAKLVNLTVDAIPSATGLQLGQAIIDNASRLKKLPTEVAIEYLKKEFAENF